MTIRSTWLVPSQIWVIVDRRAVLAGQRPDGYRGVSTDSARAAGDD